LKIEIITKNLQLDIYGFGGMAANKNYVDAAFTLSGKMWAVVKANSIKNKGKNIWVYETGDRVFAGVELEDNITANNNCGLDKMTINMEKYAYFKHIGPYNYIRQTGQHMKSELMKQGFNIILPYIEIYGHWTNDETKLETELLMCLQ
jgi:effector-binding domain-containing protein